jgi:hypothetical protein
MDPPAAKNNEETVVLDALDLGASPFEFKESKGVTA